MRRPKKLVLSTVSTFASAKAKFTSAFASAIAECQRELEWLSNIQITEFVSMRDTIVFVSLMMEVFEKLCERRLILIRTLLFLIPIYIHTQFAEYGRIHHQEGKSVLHF